jgi:hypothetical protein
MNGWAVGDSGIILHYGSGVGIAETALNRPQALTRLKVEPGIGRSAFRFSVQSDGAGVRWRVCDAEGREVWSRAGSNGELGVTWSACDETGRPCPAGAYFVQAVCRGRRLVSRLLLIR